MPVTQRLSRLLQERFGADVGGAFAGWLNEVEQRIRNRRWLVLHRPPKIVREALGEDVVDELMDTIIAATGGSCAK